MLRLVELDPEEARFIAEIRSDIFSDEPRLVYSDWLDDHQDQRAEYIRAEVNFSNFDPFSEEAKTEFERLERLLITQQFSWGWRREIGIKFDYVRRLSSEKKRLWTTKVVQKTISQSVTLAMLRNYPNQFRPESEYVILKHQR